MTYVATVATMFLFQVKFLHLAVAADARAASAQGACDAMVAQEDTSTDENTMLHLALQKSAPSKVNASKVPALQRSASSQVNASKVPAACASAPAGNSKCPRCTCGRRISRLMRRQGLDVEDAMYEVLDAFPEQCGDCIPDPQSETTPAPPSDCEMMLDFMAGDSGKTCGEHIADLKRQGNSAEQARSKVAEAFPEECDSIDEACAELDDDW